MQRLIYYHRKKYLSGGTKKLTGNSLLKVSRKPICPSAVHRIKKETLIHRGFDIPIEGDTLVLRAGTAEYRLESL